MTETWTCVTRDAHPVALSRDQLAALLAALERWEAEADSGRRLREALAQALE